MTYEYCKRNTLRSGHNHTVSVDADDDAQRHIFDSVLMKRLVISFSGGRTSGYMTKRILDEWSEIYDDIVVLFANTGCEHEKTLDFVKACDDNFGFNTVWLEAVVNPEQGKGIRHKVVTFETASRNGEPYFALTAKEGIPNVSRPNCSSRLKNYPIRSYVRDFLGHKKHDYDQCYGIRVDEIDRMSEAALAIGVKYPLVGWGIRKEHVLHWWDKQNFDLDLPEHMGNCVTCFKKSDRKLLTIAKHHPEYFEPFQRIEQENGMAGTLAAKEGKQVFFRKHRSVSDIIASSKQPFREWFPGIEEMRQQGLFTDEELDVSNGCVESCEVDFI